MHFWPESYQCFCRVWMKLVEVAKRFYQYRDHTRKMDFTAWLWGWMEFYCYSPGLCTSVHYKPTDSHSYLLYSSSHPSHVKNYIPYSQFLWPRRLCFFLKTVRGNVRFLWQTWLFCGYLLFKQAIIAPIILPPTQHHSFFRNLPPLFNSITVFVG